jgi:hypothetical protein
VVRRTARAVAANRGRSTWKIETMTLPDDSILRNSKAAADFAGAEPFHKEFA